MGFILTEVIVLTCPNCDSQKFKVDYNNIRLEETHPDVEFRDILGFCPDCKYTINMVGSKRINTSDYTGKAW